MLGLPLAGSGQRPQQVGPYPEMPRCCHVAPLEAAAMRAFTQTNLLLLSALLAGCATGPSPQWLDAQALCQQQGKASASSPELASGDYADQCMIAHGLNPRWQ